MCIYDDFDVMQKRLQCPVDEFQSAQIIVIIIIIKNILSMYRHGLEILRCHDIVQQCAKIGQTKQH